ncbi:MAG TPA: BLUF domain-containing protein [Caulobacteraceae bacterium]|nr:BLUF domain-containing protein [Caulobacteraceae bacterium]
MPTLYRLVYASQIAPICRGDLRAALTGILTHAIAANRPRAVTGLMIAHRGWFVQALEGPPDAVKDLFELIAADGRHHHALPVAEGAAEDRLFGQWPMGARLLSSGDEAVLSSLDATQPFEPMRAPHRTLTRLLSNVADVHWRLISEQQALAA